MKRLLDLALLGLLTSAALGQGQVTFNNYIPGVVDARVTETVTSPTPVLVDGSDPLFHTALLGGPFPSLAATRLDTGTLSMLASPSDPNLTYVGFGTGETAGVVDAGSDSARVLPGLDWGQTAEVQIVAWYGDYSSYADAIRADAPRGVSAPITVTLPSGPMDPNKALLVGLQGFDIPGIVPEPSVLTLVALGGSALLLLRHGGRRGNSARLVRRFGVLGR